MIKTNEGYEHDGWLIKNFGNTRMWIVHPPLIEDNDFYDFEIVDSLAEAEQIINKEVNNGNRIVSR